MADTYSAYKMVHFCGKPCFKKRRADNGCQLCSRILLNLFDSSQYCIMPVATYSATSIPEYTSKEVRITSVIA